MHNKIFLTLIAILLSPAAAVAEEIDAGNLYHEYCSVCHGDNGDGRSHATQGLVPPPRDFTTPQAALELSHERIVNAIEQGRPGTAMSGWKSRLSNEQIDALAGYIEQRFMQPAAATANDSLGARLYADYCSVCHGDSGQGAVWATVGLSPPPVNFTDARIQQGLTREHMIDAVAHGRAETAMSGWKSRLTDAEIGAVVDYVILDFMPDSEMAMALTTGHKHVNDAHAGHNHTHFNINMPFADNLRGDASRGGKLYEANCAGCHGMEGDGRGPRAYFINPKPRNFLHTNSRASLNRPTLFEAISKGRLRTEMPAWDKVLEPQQIADIGEYVFTAFIKP